VLSSDISTLPASSSIIAGTPTFVDGAHGDYHLQLVSTGVDYAPTSDVDARDLDNLPRDVDLYNLVNVWGRRDLGAYERQRTLNCGSGTAETIFCDGFEF
jgi:hypothetical protein